MGALQEARFYVIIWVIMLIWILGYFFTLQNNVNYTNYSTDLKTTYADVKANAASIKTIRDVLTIDWTNVRVMKNNQLFWLTLDWTADSIWIAWNYDSAVALADTTNMDAALWTAWAWKFKLSFITTDTDTNLQDLQVLNVPTATWIVESDWATDDFTDEADDRASSIKWVAKMDSVTTLSSLAKGWTLDSTWYVVYTFESAKVATEIMSNYLPTWTLIWTHVVVPFMSK